MTEPETFDGGAVDTPRTYTAAEVAALLAQVQAQAAAQPTYSATPVPVSQHDIWSPNAVLHAVGRQLHWFTERDARSFHASVDKHWPAEDEAA